MFEEAADPALSSWISESVGLRQATFRRPDPVGRSRDIWIVDGADAQGEARSYIARRETHRGPFSGTAFTLRREAAILRALEGAAFPAPRLAAISADGDIILIDRLAGTAAVEAGDTRSHAAMIDNFAALLARLHHLDIKGFAEVLKRPATVADHALLDLADYEAAFATYGEENAVLSRAIAWLHDNVPTAVARTSVLQGDTGPGNYMHQDGRITGLIDWETAHLGDPMGDLAWLWFRKRFLRDDADLALWYDRYAEHSGLPIDYRSICYYRVMVLLRAAIATIVRRAHNPGVDDPKPARMTALVEAALRDPFDDGGAGDALPPILSADERRRLEGRRP